jgi:hypothetical protein
MRNLIAATAASLLCLTAAPALAQSISDADANSLLGKLSTPAADLCADSDQAKLREPAEHLNACQTALTELAAARKRHSKATPGQLQVYDFMESALQMGTTFAMLRADGKPTSRVCANIESQWELANRTNTALVGPTMGGALKSTKDLVQPLVKMCREQFPDQAGTIPA